MKSNKSLFNTTLIKSNITRFLPFSILFLIIELIIYPTIIYFNYDIRTALDFDALIILGIVSDVFACIFACIFAILVFSYLFSANKCIAIHSFPIGRKALFATNLISAYVLLVVPQLIGLLIAVPGIIMFSGAVVAQTALLLQFSTIFLLSFIALSIGTLAMMLAGNAFAGAIIYVILNFVYSAMVTLASFALSIFGTGLGEEVLITDKGAYVLSPFVDLLVNLTQYDSDKFYGQKGYYTALIIYFAVSFAICALAFLLYKLRELEVAGEMAAFEKELPFIRVIVSIIGGAILSIFIGEISSAGKIIFALLYIVFSFIVYFATQMVLKRKFNIFSFKLFIRWFICCSLSLGFVIGFAAYETNYIPSADKVEAASINTTYNIECKDEKNIKKVQQLQKELINYLSVDERFITTADTGENEVSDKRYINILINYKLKNGKTVQRSYEYQGANKKISGLINDIENSNGYVDIFDYIDSLGIKYKVRSMTLAEINDSGAMDVELASKDYEKAFALCKEDVHAMTESYNSLVSGLGGQDCEICIGCSIDKTTDKKAIEKFRQNADSSFVEGYYSYYDSDTGDFDIYINRLPENSKLMSFAKANQQ